MVTVILVLSDLRRGCVVLLLCMKRHGLLNVESKPSIGGSYETTLMRADDLERHTRYTSFFFFENIMIHNAQ